MSWEISCGAPCRAQPLGSIEPHDIAAPHTLGTYSPAPWVATNASSHHLVVSRPIGREFIGFKIVNSATTIKHYTLVYEIGVDLRKSPIFDSYVKP